MKSPPVLIDNLGRIKVERADFSNTHSTNKKSTLLLTRIHDPVEVLSRRPTQVPSSTSCIPSSAAESFILFDDVKCPVPLSRDEFKQLTRKNACLTIYQEVEVVTTRESETSTHDLSSDEKNTQASTNPTFRKVVKDLEQHGCINVKSTSSKEGQGQPNRVDIILINDRTLARSFRKVK